MNQLSYYGMTDPGRCRENNEDAYLLERKGSYVIAAVADGIGDMKAVKSPPILPVSASPIICGALRKRLWERMY